MPKLLDFQKAEAIRSLYKNGGHTLDTLAALYGVTRFNISYILNHKSFKVDPAKAKEATFWKYVDKGGPTPKDNPELGPCWIWMKYISMTKGYGQYRNQLPHRYSFFLANGRYPSDQTRHMCHTRACVNPSHLREGSDQDNADDMMAAGRQCRGEDSTSSKLTGRQVLKIRAMYETGNYTYAALGELFGVWSSSIGKIVTRQRWTHI